MRQETTHGSPQRRIRPKRTSTSKTKRKTHMLAGIKVKREVRKAERLTSHDKNIASARPNVSKAHDGYEGNNAPSSNGERTMTHPKHGFLKTETTKRHGNRNSQYGGNRIWWINIHRDDKDRNHKERKNHSFSGWQRPGLDQKVSKIQM